MPRRDDARPWERQLAELRSEQAGVVARWQLTAAGAAPHDVARLVRRRELVAVHPGVYVDHTGEPTWVQRAWAAVLWLRPASLYGASALRAADGPGRRDRDDDTIHVAVDRRRSAPRPLRGVRVHFVADLQDSTHWHRSPPRRRYEEAVLDVALGATDDLAAVDAVTRAVGSRATTADRLRTALDRRPRARRRQWLEGVLDDARDGTHSVLEHGYLVRVERAHGLPTARRQRRAGSPTGVVCRDAAYGDAGAYVELDGRLHHGSPEQWDADLERDLDSAAEGRATVRLGFRQVFARSCETAAKVGRFLEGRGVVVRLRGCGPGCDAGVDAA